MEEHDPVTCPLCRVPEVVQAQMELLGLRMSFESKTQTYHVRNRTGGWMEMGVYQTPGDWSGVMERYIAWRDAPRVNHRS